MCLTWELQGLELELHHKLLWSWWNSQQHYRQLQVAAENLSAVGPAVCFECAGELVGLVAAVDLVEAAACVVAYMAAYQAPLRSQT